MGRGIYDRLKTNFYKYNICNCQYCSKEFKNRISLKSHELLCEKNPNRSISVCQYCGRICSNQGGLKTHELSCVKNPNKIIRTKYHPEYQNMSDDEILNIFHTEYQHVKIPNELAKINNSLCGQLAGRNLLDVVFPNRKRINRHSEYQKMSDKEIINIYHTEYSHVKNQLELRKINLALLNQLRKRNIIDIVFPNRRIMHSKDSKLNLLTKYDLESLDEISLLILMDLNKLPKEFNSLIKFPAHTPGRKQMMQDLIDTYNITPIEEEKEKDNEDIPEVERENKIIGDILEDYNEEFANDCKFKYLRRYSLNKLWQNVWADNNYINEIYKKIENNSLTKFEKFIYEEFLDEYNEVENMEIH